MIEAVIFDMDGLMFDTETLAVPAWEWVAKELGYPIQEEHVYNIFGKGVDQIENYFSEICHGNFDFETSWNMKLNYVTDWVKENGVPIKSGLINLLEYLNGDYKMAVASSTNGSEVNRYLKMAEVDTYFDTVISGDMVKKGKPAPDIFLKAASTIGVQPQNCLVLEDALSGIAAASAAGMKSIMIPDKIEPDERTRQLCLCEKQNLNEVIDVLEKMN
ncbi:MAG: HAD family phosphatase [Anaerostipes sp.]|nr:HAD family phosphatase [Anaerostipes sp.]